MADKGDAGDWREPVATLKSSLGESWLMQQLEAVQRRMGMDDTIKAYLPKKHDGHDVMVRGDGLRTWRASNDTLKAKTEGLAFRAAIDGLKIDADNEILKWGERVQGDERDGWIECRIRPKKAKKDGKERLSPTKACDNLLERVGAMCPSGVRVSQEWSVFCGKREEYEKSKRPAKRVPTNVTRFAGNYINVIFGCAVFMTLVGSPYSMVSILVMQALALLGDSIGEVVGYKLPEGDDASENWIRYGLAILSHVLLLVMPFRSSYGLVGILLGVAIVAMHAIMRKRTPVAMGVDILTDGNGGAAAGLLRNLQKLVAS